MTHFFDSQCRTDRREGEGGDRTHFSHLPSRNPVSATDSSAGATPLAKVYTSISISSIDAEWSFSLQCCCHALAAYYKIICKLLVLFLKKIIILFGETVMTLSLIYLCLHFVQINMFINK